VSAWLVSDITMKAANVQQYVMTAIIPLVDGYHAQNKIIVQQLVILLMDVFEYKHNLGSVKQKISRAVLINEYSRH